MQKATDYSKETYAKQMDLALDTTSAYSFSHPPLQKLSDEEINALMSGDNPQMMLASHNTAQADPLPIRDEAWDNRCIVGFQTSYTWNSVPEYSNGNNDDSGVKKICPPILSIYMKM